MPGSIYVKTLRDLRGQIIVWSVGVAVIGAANVLIFPTIQGIPGLVSFMENLPPIFQSMAGDLSTMVTPVGFLRIKMFDPLPLLLAIFAVTHGAQALAGELEGKTIDILLSQPVRRWRVVVEKFLAIATALVVISLVLALALALSGWSVGLEIRTGHLVLAALAGLPLAWLFTALAVLCSCAVRRARHAAIVTGSVVVASYTFETLALLSPVVGRWQAFSLFHYHKAGFTLAGEIVAGPICLLLGLVAGLVVAALVVYERRDLAA